MLVAVLPAVSRVVTDASMILSGSAANSEPNTLIEKVLSPLTRPVYVLPLTVSVTVSPDLASPPTTPVTGIGCANSAAVRTPSPEMLPSNVIVATGGVVSAALGSNCAGSLLAASRLIESVVVTSSIRRIRTKPLPSPSPPPPAPEPAAVASNWVERSPPCAMTLAISAAPLLALASVASDLSTGLTPSRTVSIKSSRPASTARA